MAPAKIPARLSPAPAAAAIIVTEDGRYLMQLRDSKPDIWFPDHWGLFGGAMEPDETAEQALLRELSEEIGLSPRPLVYFSRFQYDMDFAGAGVIDRLYFETSSTAREVSGLRVAEGRRLGLFSPTELASLRMTPYDSFCLWLHANRARIGHAAR